MAYQPLGHHYYKLGPPLTENPVVNFFLFFPVLGTLDIKEHLGICQMSWTFFFPAETVRTCVLKILNFSFSAISFNLLELQKKIKPCFGNFALRKYLTGPWSSGLARKK